MGRKVRLTRYPRKVVSLVPSQTELLFDLDAAELVAGATRFCVHPAGPLQQVPRVGGTKKLNLDRIREIAPDLIIGNKEENSREEIEALEREFTVWMSDVNTLADSLEMIRQVGVILGREDRAEALCRAIGEEFARLREESTRLGEGPARREEDAGKEKDAGKQERSRKTAYFIWKDPYMLAGRETFIDSMLAACGLENAVSISRYPVLTAAELKALPVGQVFLSSEPYPFREKHLAEFAGLFPGADIRLVDGEMFSWYGSRLLKAPAYFLRLLKEGRAPL